MAIIGHIFAHIRHDVHKLTRNYAQIVTPEQSVKCISTIAQNTFYLFRCYSKRGFERSTEMTLR